MSKANHFTIVERPNKKAVYRNLPGWRFDAGVWVESSLTNRAFQLPSREDIDLTGIPENYYESGVGGHEDLEFDEINFEDKRVLDGWTPGVRIGKYFVHSKSHTLHGTNSLLALVRDEVADDDSGRSVLQVDQRPDFFGPITAEYLTRHGTRLSVEPGVQFAKVVKFKGVAANGRELDGDDFNNTDTSKYQFRVVRNENEPERWVPIIDGDNFALIEAGIYKVTLDDDPVAWWRVKFSRPDIFQNELTLEDFLARQVDPVANGDLAEGDYCVGYAGQATSIGVRVKLAAVALDLGHISYKPGNDATFLFNKDVRIARVETFEAAGDNIFYLTHFPVLDLSEYRDGDLVGALELDTASGVLTVAAVEWTRVDNLADEAADAQVYELDPLWGELRFGDGGENTNGALPDGEIEYTYTQVPLVQYDVVGSRKLFDDPREDLDPQTNALKRGFLVLDNRRLIPWKIELSANAPLMRRSDGSCCYGPLQVPPGSVDDIAVLRARVIARGQPPEGVPNTPVRFESLDGLIDFSQEFSITDGDGYAYTEAMGGVHWDEYVVSNHMYLPMDPLADPYLNPDPDDLVLWVPAWGPVIAGADITVEERFEGELDDVYLLIQSIPADTPGDVLDYAAGPLPADDWLTPYNGKTQKDGLTVVWHRTVDDAEEVIHPIASAPGPNPELTTFTFPIAIPTGRLIVAYKIVIDRTAHVVAHTVEEPILDSNQLEICLQLNSSMKGQWKLPNLAAPDNVDFLENPPGGSEVSGSRISSAVYMSPNDMTVTQIEPEGGGAALAFITLGDTVDIIGTSFPHPDPTELWLSVYIVKVDTSGDILAVKDITEVCDHLSNHTIRINELPAPPTEEYNVNYWIAVAGFHPLDDTGVRRTATEIEIRNV